MTIQVARLAKLQQGLTIPERLDAMLARYHAALPPKRSLVDSIPVRDVERWNRIAGLLNATHVQLRWLVKRWLERDKVDLAAALKLEPDGSGETTPKEITDLTMGELLGFSPLRTTGRPSASSTTGSPSVPNSMRSAKFARR